MTDRSAPGEVRLTPLAPMMAWPARKAIKLVTVPTAKAAAPKSRPWRR